MTSSAEFAQTENTASKRARSVRAPQVAGHFYPNEANRLAEVVEGYLAQARPSGQVRPKVLVAPHAGYDFSGPVAGTGYAAVTEAKGQIRRIVLIGPAHRVSFKGLVTTTAEALATPLGSVAVDWPSVQMVLSLPGVSVDDGPFQNEHSLEVHLPFIQRAFPQAEVVPLLVGHADRALVRSVVKRLWGGPETLVLVSSDLSHFLDQASATTRDTETRRDIELLLPEKMSAEAACGHRVLAGVLELAREHDLRVTGLDVRTSYDTNGLAPERVVGYGAFAMEYAEQARVTEGDRQQLIDAARLSIKHGIRTGKPPEVRIQPKLSPALAAQRASFVTLTISGKLRGCIGSMVARRPLISDVVGHAYNAAFADPRFPPLTEAEVAEMDISVSILSTPRPIKFDDEAHLLHQMRPDQDGLILQDGEKRGLFLPSVWESLPDSRAFLSGLKRKAGLPSDHWADTLRIFRYSTESFGGRLQHMPKNTQ